MVARTVTLTSSTVHRNLCAVTYCLAGVPHPPLHTAGTGWGRQGGVTCTAVVTVLGTISRATVIAHPASITGTFTGRRVTATVSRAIQIVQPWTAVGLAEITATTDTLTRTADTVPSVRAFDITLHAVKTGITLTGAIGHATICAQAFTSWTEVLSVA